MTTTMVPAKGIGGTVTTGGTAGVVCTGKGEGDSEERGERLEERGGGKSKVALFNSIYREESFRKPNPNNPFQSQPACSPAGDPRVHVPNTHFNPKFSLNSCFNPISGSKIHNHKNSNSWIFDCGATHTMISDPCDVLSHKPSSHTQIKIATRDCVHVDSEGQIAILPHLKLKHGLLIPNLSHKLHSISQLTKKLDCTVLMTAHGCIVQDAQTQKIIFHGTESGGLYYLDAASLVLRGS